MYNPHHTDTKLTSGTVFTVGNVIASGFSSSFTSGLAFIVANVIASG
jgi:hypothetical protein